MRLVIVFFISFVVGNYALSLPLADAGMTPDYALGDNQVKPVELEMGGDYINMDMIDSNQQKKDIRKHDYIADIIEDDQSSLIDTKEYLSVNGPEENESNLKESDAMDGIHQLDIDYHHYHSHNRGHYTLPVESDPTI